MKSYIIKPKSVKKSEIVSKYYSFLPSEHRKVEIFNKKQETIQNLVEFEDVGSQIDVQEYLTFDSRHYLGTISCMNSLIYDETRGEKISPNIHKKSSKKIKKGDVIISRNASLGKIAFVNNDSKIILNGGLSLLRFQEKYKYYATAFFIVEYGAEYLTCLTSGGGTQQNAKRQNLLDVPVPFPTTTNHLNPEKVEALVSLIVQNIIHKEEQIKIKNKQIDELIEKELKENQKAGNFSYKYPRISEIREETRLDSGLYEKEFKEIDFLIRNYNKNYSFIDEKEIQGGNTPKQRIFGKGNLWLTPTDCKKGILANKSLIKSQKYNLNDDYLVIVNRSNVAETVLFRKDIFKIGQHNQGMYRVKINKENYNYYLFILSWFNSSTFQKYIGDVATGATFKEIRIDDISKKSPIPNFPESKQQEIAKLYYNPLEKNKGLDLENYLEREHARNSEVGIFQLNMEIFSLREQLEDLVHKIVMEEKIELRFEY